MIGEIGDVKILRAGKERRTFQLLGPLSMDMSVRRKQVERIRANRQKLKTLTKAGR